MGLQEVLQKPENATSLREPSEGWGVRQHGLCPTHNLSTHLQTVTGMKQEGSHFTVTEELLLDACLYLIFLLLIFI